MSTEIFKPNELSEDKIYEFYNLVIKGDQVSNSSLKERIKNAELLAFKRENEVLIGVGAIKNPKKSYRDGVFNKCGHAELSNNYVYEFGYLYVEEQYRKNGIGYEIYEAITKDIDKNKIFITTRESNNNMKLFLPKISFEKLGDNYKSDLGDHELACYIIKTEQKQSTQ